MLPLDSDENSPLESNEGNPSEDGSNKKKKRFKPTQYKTESTILMKKACIILRFKYVSGDDSVSRTSRLNYN